MRSLLIRASAGSGKTYQLALRFIALVALGVDPSRIVALTFTRKAAGEFADRILQRLAAAAQNVDKATVLANELEDAVKRLDEKNTRPLPRTPDDFRLVLQKVVADLGRLSCGTYDSFFARIVRLHAPDLGLGGFQFLEPVDALREKNRILAKILERMGSAQTREFLEAFKRATVGRSEIRLTESLSKFVEEHHQRYLTAPDSAVWGSEDAIWGGKNPWPKSPKDLEATAEVIRNATTHWRTAAARALDKLLCALVEQPDTTPEGTMCERLLLQIAELRDGHVEFKYGNAKDPLVLSGKAADALYALLGANIGLQIYHAQLQTQGVWQVLDTYEDHYHRMVRQTGCVQFADLTLLLQDIALGDIGYRLDQWFDHWMLDEFQDTNMSQWNVISGLLQEVQQDPENARTLFVVGDVKQAVHRWRGAEPRLFDIILKDPGWKPRMDVLPINVSFRSSPTVLDAVNDLCDPKHQPWMQELFPAETLARWSDQFQAHKATLTTPGFVAAYECVETSDDSEEAEQKLEYRATASLLRETQPIERELSCALLVQSNAEAQAIGNFLRSEGFPVEIEAETAPGADSPAGAALLDFFCWLHAPHDRLAWGHLLASPLHLALCEELQATTESDLWQAGRSCFASGGAAPLVSGLTQRLRATGLMDAFNTARCADWESEAVRFDVRGGDPGEFAEWMTWCAQPEHSRHGAIQVMTIHRAKGLEFDLVILPCLAGKGFTDGGKRGMVESSDAQGNKRLILFAPEKKVRNADVTGLARVEREWEVKLCEERFAQFYVAITRAKRALIFVLPPRGKTVSQNFAWWIRNAYTPAEEAEEKLIGVTPVLCLHEAGNSQWFETHALRPSAPSTPKPPRLVPCSGRPNSIHPSTLAHTEKGGSRRQAMARGTAIHEALRAFGWMGDPAPQTEDPEIAIVFARLFTDETIQKLFTRPAGELDLWREQPFDWISAKGDWISGVFDRVHVHRHNGTPIAATLIDFKTGPVVSDGRYDTQMQTYRAGLASALGLPLSTITALLVFTDIPSILEISDA